LKTEDARRVEELLAVNERLAAEVRSLALGRAEQPRSSSMTAARRLGALIDERDQLLRQVDELTASVESAHRNREELERHRVELAAEVERLRGGWRGLGRRAWARLLRRSTATFPNK